MAEEKALGRPASGGRSSSSLLNSISSIKPDLYVCTFVGFPEIAINAISSTMFLIRNATNLAVGQVSSFVVQECGVVRRPIFWHKVAKLVANISNVAKNLHAQQPRTPLQHLPDPTMAPPSLKTINRGGGRRL